VLAREPGFRADRDEDLSALRGLLDAAALDSSLTIRLPDIFSATYPAVVDVVESTFSANLGRAVEIEINQYARIFEGIGDGSVPIVIGWGSAITDPDPTDRLWATMRTDAEGNRGGFSDPTTDTWLATARETLQLEQRQRIYQEAITPALLGEPAWIVPIGHGVQRLAHRGDIVLPSFGFGWDGYRYEEAWRVSTGT
jgi:ABC-type transport system substrate-binding protein